MSRGLAIETKNLTKRYERFTAVEGLNFSVEEGEIFGLLGPNGAGKTTTVLMLLGLTEPTLGSCRVCGLDPIQKPLEVKRVSGYIPERVGFYLDLTTKQNLKYMARLNGIPDKEASKRIDEVLLKVNLSDRADTQVGKFSRGMKQRLGIANVLMKKPKIAFMDEPIQGIDPKGTVEMLDLFMRLSKEDGITILLSSHLLYQVQQICDHVGIMFEGRMITQGTIEDLEKERGQKWIIEIEVKDVTEQLIEDLANLRGVKGIERREELIVVECDRDIRPEISSIIVNGKASLLGLKARKSSLDEIYLKHFAQG